MEFVPNFDMPKQRMTKEIDMENERRREKVQRERRKRKGAEERSSEKGIVEKEGSGGQENSKAEALSTSKHGKRIGNRGQFCVFTTSRNITITDIVHCQMDRFTYQRRHDD